MEPERGMLDERPRLRTAVFAFLAFWILATPAVRQVFGRPVKWARSWTMFRGVGVELRAVRFYRAEDPQRTPLEWPSLPAGPRERLQYGPYDRRIRSDEDFRWVAEHLCAELGEGADLRASVREAGYDGWETSLDGQRNLCSGGAGVR